MKILYQFVNSIRKLYWFLFRPHTQGVKVVIFHDNDVFLIKNSYGSYSWTLPGGNIEKNETPESAAIREVKEEIGINLNEVHLIKKQFSDREYKKDTIFIFKSETNTIDYSIDKNEIKDAGWFHMHSLPDELSSITKEILSKK